MIAIWRILYAFFIIAGMFAGIREAFAVDIAIRAPVDNHHDCLTEYQKLDPIARENIGLWGAFDLAGPSAVSCGEDTLLSSAQAISDNIISRHPMCKISSKKAPCIKDFKASLFAYPIEGGCFPYHTWLPVELVSGAKSELKKFLSVAKKGSSYEGKFQIVGALEYVGEEQHLAVCTVTDIDGRHGPPKDCHTAVIVTPQQTYIRVLEVTRDAWCQTAAEIRASGAINIKFEISKLADASVLSEPFLDMLKTKLALSTEYDVRKSTETGKIEEINFTSTTGLRDSKLIAGGWREALDFDVDVRTKDDGSVSIIGHTQPIISRYASGNLTEYHAPNDAQRSTYAKAFNDSVIEAINKACPSAVQLDDRRIQCN